FENQDLSKSIGYSIDDLSEIEQVLDAPLTPAEPKTTLEVETTTEPEVNWISHTIKRGDNLSGIFKKRGGTLVEAIEVAKLDDAKWLKRLRSGRKLDLQFADDGSLVALRYELDAIRYRFLERDESGGYVSAIRERDYELRQSRADGIIKSSLFQAAGQAGISDKLVANFAGIFGWNIDFSSEIQKGDRFSLIYDEKVINDKVVGGGVIHAAEFAHAGEVYRAIRHVDEDGYEAYYTPEGQSLKRAFLRSPMQFSRVTSGFSKRRYHPVLKKWRAHKGVDYGAPRGTPILATADGRITHLGRKNGYGKAIILKHGHQYSTLYAHMSRYKKGLKSGGKVRQGDVIGYVGSTGLATGPHLHYEFRLNGTHRNPLTVELPTSNPIEKKYRAEFLQHAEKWVAALNGNDQRLIAANTNSAN
ncbi:MAG: peptidoglycan DD-metalloendopeptidase family protein, partial [Gammaproteobacteria bacterium]|nr:peptidoglycan DD-metalloendopeptidase family protein [Gammaproteobacteria bacterium]